MLFLSDLHDECIPRSYAVEYQSIDFGKHRALSTGSNRNGNAVIVCVMVSVYGGGSHLQILR